MFAKCLLAKEKAPDIQELWFFLILVTVLEVVTVLGAQEREASQS